MERTLEKEKAKWREVEEQRLKSKIETELALAKMDWNKVSSNKYPARFFVLTGLAVSAESSLR